MASRIQGITVEIGGDTTKFTTALKGVNSEIRNTQSQLRDVEKLLKLDPGNTELLSQKQRLLNEEVQATKEKLEALNVAKLVGEVDGELKKMLQLRQQLAKSSVKKYQAMQNAVCADGRARGMFQFYGANRSGRWAGRIIQLQNLPQNHMEDLEEAIGLVRNGDYSALSMLYDSVPEVLCSEYLWRKCKKD